VSDLALVLILKEKMVDFVSYKTGKVVEVKPSVVQALDKTCFKWFVMLCCYCIESNGKQKLVTLPVQLQAAYKHDQLTDFLREAHQELIDKAKEHNQVINAGWFALPMPPKQLDEDKLVTLLLDKQEYWRVAE
jgi:hypothetical protein